jgi:hypothetical protein
MGEKRYTASDFTLVYDGFALAADASLVGWIRQLVDIIELNAMVTSGSSGRSTRSLTFRARIRYLGAWSRRRWSRCTAVEAVVIAYEDTGRASWA